MKTLRSLVVLLAVGAIPACLSAQANSNSYNAGVAQVNGRIHLDAADPAASLADFAIASADSGVLQTKMSFKSTRIVVENDQVEVIGDLTLTTMQRDASYNPGEDYAGAMYGEDVTRKITHQVVFAFSKEEFAQQNAEGRISATAVIGRENFPGLLPAIYAANWPVVVEHERCQIQSAGEDYAGPICTGRFVKTANAAFVPANVSEDYRGSEVMAPAGNLVRIVLNLQMSGEGPIGTASFFVG